MPTFKSRKTNRGLFSENNVNRALRDIQAKTYSFRQASKVYGIPAGTLHRYKQKMIPEEENIKKSSMVTAQIFTTEEDQALKKHVLHLSKLFYGLDKLKLRKLAYVYAVIKNKQVPDLWHKKEMVGEDWFEGFRKRMGNMSLRKLESTSIGRAMAFNQHNVKIFFDNIKVVYERLGLQATKIWNLDETSVSTVPNSKQILFLTGSRQVGQIKSGERGINVTMYCCINAGGNALPPAFIFPRVRFKSSMLRGAPAGSLWLANPSGWMKYDMFPEVLSHFICNMTVSKDQPGVLVMDNHSSHLNVETIELARKHGLSLVTLPPHCSLWMLACLVHSNGITVLKKGSAVSLNLLQTCP